MFGQGNRLGEQAARGLGENSAPDASRLIWCAVNGNHRTLLTAARVTGLRATIARPQENAGGNPTIRGPVTKRYG